MTIHKPQKQWWAPVWKGLVMDGDAKHYRRMKSAVWLYLYFLLNADRGTGLLKRKLQTMSVDLGITRDTAIRWLNVLRTHGYVTTTNTGRSLTIQVQRWKPIAKVASNRSQLADSANRSNRNYPTPQQTPDRTFPLGRDRTSGNSETPKETKIQIYLHNEMHANQQSATADRDFDPPAWTWRERLAQEMATVLGDQNHINLYRSYCWKYPEWLLRKTLNKTKETPHITVNQSRAEVFTQLIHSYAQGTTDDRRH